eukprot:146759-Rhodomonas_salina.1
MSLLPSFAKRLRGGRCTHTHHVMPRHTDTHRDRGIAHAQADRDTQTGWDSDDLRLSRAAG